jgi:hypothetical protein
MKETSGWDLKQPSTKRETMMVVADVVTMIDLHKRSIEELQVALKNLKEDESDEDFKAHAIAWERMSVSSLKLCFEAIEELVKVDETYRTLISIRWKETKEVVVKTVPLVKLLMDEHGLSGKPVNYEGKITDE